MSSSMVGYVWTHILIEANNMCISLFVRYSKASHTRKEVLLVDQTLAPRIKPQVLHLPIPSSHHPPSTPGHPRRWRIKTTKEFETNLEGATGKTHTFGPLFRITNGSPQKTHQSHEKTICGGKKRFCQVRAEEKSDDHYTGDFYGIFRWFGIWQWQRPPSNDGFLLKSRGILVGFQTYNLQAMMFFHVATPRKKWCVSGICSRQIPRWNLWYKVGHQL